MERTAYDTYRNTIGRCVCLEREARGWSLREFAPMAGINYRHLHRLEHGELDFKLHTLYRIADALGMTLSELLAKAEAIGATSEPLVVTYEVLEPNRARRQ